MICRRSHIHTHTRTYTHIHTHMYTRTYIVYYCVTTPRADRDRFTILVLCFKVFVHVNEEKKKKQLIDCVNF